MKNLSLSLKLILVLSIFIVGSITISYQGLTKVDTINQTLDQMIDGSVKRVDEAHQIKELFLTQLIYEKDLILSRDKEEIQSLIEKIKERDSKIKKLFSDVKKTGAGERINELISIYDQWWNLLVKVEEYALNGDTEKASLTSLVNARDLRIKAQDQIELIIERSNKEILADRSFSKQVYERGKWIIIMTSLIAISIGIMLAFFVIKNLRRDINNVITNLKENSFEVTVAAGQIASSSNELSDAANKQASSLDETAASVEELSSMVRRNAENAQKTSELSEQSTESANKGKVVVHEMISAIHEISASNDEVLVKVEDSNKELSQIINVIADISDRTKVIHDIVFQTKLLSFNASVEAARAGEHGKGFSVVAEEIGNLAQMSGKAAKEIKDMLDESIGRVSEIVETTQESVGSIVRVSKNKVERGQDIAKQCSEVLEDIVHQISTVKMMAHDISQASHEQAQGINEINQAMGMLDKVTQTNRISSEEAASSATQLEVQAHSLSKTVAQLFQTINGAREVEKTKAPAQVIDFPEIKKTREEINPDDERFKEIS